MQLEFKGPVGPWQRDVLYFLISVLEHTTLHFTTHIHCEARVTDELLHGPFSSFRVTEQQVAEKSDSYFKGLLLIVLFFALIVNSRNLDE